MAPAMKQYEEMKDPYPSETKNVIEEYRELNDKIDIVLEKISIRKSLKSKK